MTVCSESVSPRRVVTVARSPSSFTDCYSTDWRVLSKMPIALRTASASSRLSPSENC